MTVLARGAVDPADEFVLLVPALALLVLAGSGNGGVNALRSATSPPPPDADR